MNFPWRTALFVSLAVNLVVISAAIGALATGARLARPADREEAPRLAGQRAFMQALPPETRRALRREVGRELMAMREERAAARAARMQVFEAARAEPYDAEQVRAAFAAMREADGAVIAGFHGALAEGFARLSAEQRATALDALARGRGNEAQADGGDGAPEAEPGAAAAPEERRERLRERWRERREQRSRQN
jgi:uncharacterized membrane protein